MMNLFKKIDNPYEYKNIIENVTNLLIEWHRKVAWVQGIGWGIMSHFPSAYQ